MSKCFVLQVKWSGVRTQHSTTPFVDDMYERLKETLTDYEVIICRWPEYTLVLENVCLILLSLSSSVIFLFLMNFRYCQILFFATILF
jgi:hypothetical protein